MKIISKFIFILLFLITVLVSYLSIFGVETDRFNSQIINKLKKIDKNIEVELKKIKLVLDPFALKLNIKTIGSKIKKQNQTFEIENIKSQISLKSLATNKFSIENLEISTKSLEIKNFISFLKSFQFTPELFFLEKAIDKGYLIADIKIEFDDKGNVKNNYKIDGFIKNAKLSFFKNYNIEKFNLVFDYQENNLILRNILFSLNNFNFSSDEISLKKINNNFLIEGNVNHKSININEKNLDLFIKPFFKNLDVNNIKFSSDNFFLFEISKKFKLNDFKIKSEMSIDEFSIINNFNLKDIFPNIKKNILFSDSKLSIDYKKNYFNINGKGDILLQDKKDNFEFSVNKKNDILNFKNSLVIKNNPFFLGLLNYKKDEKIETYLEYEGKQNLKNETLIKKFLLNENKNKIELRNLVLNKKFEIIELESVKLNFTDKDKKKNILNFNKKKNLYYLKGSNFNANKLIDELLFNEKDVPKVFNIDNKIIVDIDQIQLDNEYDIFNFAGDITYRNKQIIKANLTGNFSNNKKLNFTITTNQDNKITTLFVDKAEPIVR